MEHQNSEDSTYADRFFERSVDPICIVDIDSRLLRSNPAFERLTGLSAESSRHSFLDVIEAGDRETARTKINSLGPDTPFVVFEGRCQGGNGRDTWLSWSAQLDPGSNLISLSGRDISHLKRSNDGLQEKCEDFEREVRFYKSILDSLDDCVYAWNRREQFIYANRTVEDLWALSVEEYHGKRPVELGYPPELHELFSEQIARVFDTGEAITGEIPYTSPTETFGFFEYIFTPMFDEHGNVELVSGVSRNTTRRRNVEDALRSSEERLRLAIDAADMYSFEIDLLDRSFKWSENAKEIVDFSMPQTMNDALAIPHPDDREAVSRAFFEAVEKCGEFEVEYRVGNHPPGDELWLFSVGVAIDDEDGVPTRVVGITQNITERKRADQLLWEARERQSFLLELSDRIGLLTDPREIMFSASESLGRQLDVSQVGYAEVEDDEETFTTGGEYSDGRMPSLVGYRSRLSDHGPGLGPALRSGEDLLYDDNRTDPLTVPGGSAASHAIAVIAGAAIPLIKRGKLVAFLYAVNPERREWSDHDRQLLRAVAERTWDAVERARAEMDREQARREAEKAVRVRDMFLAISSHELRNPMASIRASAQLLGRFFERSENGGEREQKLVSTLIDSGNRLASLVDDLLDVSRLQSGQLRVRTQSTDLADLVRTTVEEHRKSRHEHPIQVDVQHGPMHKVDPERIRQILTNLLDNAAKYSQDGTQIRVRLTHEETGSTLSVEDRGIGLPADGLESIFEPFGRASNAAASNIPGMGLGLYICRRLAEAHGGKLWAESHGDGQGAILNLWLPIEGGNGSE